jgi:hypothetical protein
MLMLVLSLGCGALMVGLSAYQYLTGKRHANFALLCQAVDSRNHVWTWLLVAAGIVCPLLAETFQASWLHYADAGASVVIGLLILQSAVELTKELFKPGEEPTDISHFMRSAQERRRAQVVFGWVADQLRDMPLTAAQLEERFTRRFCAQTPKILPLTGTGITLKTAGTYTAPGAVCQSEEIAHHPKQVFSWLTAIDTSSLQNSSKHQFDHHPHHRI